MGYTLDYPASGDWLLTNKFYELAGAACKKHTQAELRQAVDESFAALSRHHLVRDTEAEWRQFAQFYGGLSARLDLGLTEAAAREIARDRTFNMANYVLYPDTAEVLAALAKTHRLGVISDTWPSIEQQLQTLGIRRYFSSTTYSSSLGTFKPDPRMYLDALEKMGLPAGDTVFIDDLPRNLAGAAALGITPILIAANPASDVETPFYKIHALKELL